jgi:hypothetical protein
MSDKRKDTALALLVRTAALKIVMQSPSSIERLTAFAMCVLDLKYAYRANKQ